MWILKKCRLDLGKSIEFSRNILFPKQFGNLIFYYYFPKLQLCRYVIIIIISKHKNKKYKVKAWDKRRIYYIIRETSISKTLCCPLFIAQCNNTYNEIDTLENIWEWMAVTIGVCQII